MLHAAVGRTHNGPEGAGPVFQTVTSAVDPWARGVYSRGASYKIAKDKQGITMISPFTRSNTFIAEPKFLGDLGSNALLPV